MISILTSLAAADEPAVSLVFAEGGPTVTAHEALCMEDVPWHCLRPVAGERLVVVEGALVPQWSDEVGSIKFGADGYGLSVGGALHKRLADVSGLLADEAVSTLYVSRPYGWKERPEVPFAWAFVVPATARAATLRVGAAEAALELPEAAAPVADPRRFAAVEVTYARALGTERALETTIAGERVIDQVAVGCALLEVGVSFRGLAGPNVGYGSNNYLLYTRDLALRTSTIGYLRPMEDAPSSAWPGVEHSRSVTDGETETVTMLYCVPEGTSEGSLLFRGQVVDDFVVEGATPPKQPAPAPPKKAKR
jgi:hypothetical protein